MSKLTPKEVETLARSVFQTKEELRDKIEKIKAEMDELGKRIIVI